MGGLAHYLEGAGIATTQISLVRPHTEKIRPPRALWVSFELGRPFGPPGDRPFQTRVIRTVLELLERPHGPVLEDYPEDLPAAAQQDGNWVCPVSYSALPAELSGDAALAAAFATEMGRLLPWYERALDGLGRTTVGVSTLDLDGVRDFFHDLLVAEPPAAIGELALADSIRLAAEDLKAFYFEAAAAQPGGPSSRQLTDWFWHATQAGTLLRALKTRFEASEDKSLQLLGQLLLVPRVAVDPRKQ